MLTIDHATVLDVDTGEVVDGIDAQLVDAAHLTGTVTGVGGELLPLAAVVAYAWHDGHWDDVGIAFADDTDNGDYDLGGLSPGTYRLEFFSFRIEDDEGNIIGINADEFWNDQPTLELAQDIVISEAGEVLTGYDAVLEDGQYPSDVENLTPPAISGSPVGRPDADGIARHLEPRGDDLPLPVVRGYDARRHRHADLLPDRGRRRQDHHRDGRRFGRRPRQRRRHLGPDGGGDRRIRGAAATATAGRQADRQPQAARRSRAPSRWAAEPESRPDCGARPRWT